ncbi:Clp protease N-terminal domain-containing protein [Actinoplanes subtropicus]|uniref:Clp protease N-terminal domain-containing protein n=1 Tax=Actinoplanes subtropicus TaxID=543632 RepID=UPI0006907924|nr:Clp protease N-terminal domain-containing protein [Actinoplanes subtropicus]
MFEKFTDRARQVVVLAQEEARLLSHNYIGTEHVLLAVADQSDDVGASVLADAGLTREALRAEIETTIGRGQAPASGHVPFTPRAKKSLELAMREAMKYDDMITPTHLLLGLLRQGDCAAVRLITKMGQDPQRLRARVVELSTPEPAPPPPPARLSGSSLAPAMGLARPMPALDRYARNLDEAARQGRLNPVTGRDEEIAGLARVLSRHTRNNAILTGEPGSGRLAVAEGLAQLIARGEAPQNLKDKRLYVVEFGLIAAGAADHAEAERRVIALLTSIRERGRTIVVTEELAPFAGMPGDHGGLFGAFVRSAMERQELQLISTATPSALREQLARDPRLAAVVQRVTVEAPDQASAVAMLESTRLRLAEHHHVRIDPELLKVVVALAVDLGTLPASAIDLLDEACAGSAENSAIGEAEVREAAARLRER